MLLVRYGCIPENARFGCALTECPARGERVVVQTHRGQELGTVLEIVRQKTNGHSQNGHDDPAANDTASDLHVLRRAGTEDEATYDELRKNVQTEYPAWQQRIAEWRLELELIDLEWTLDRGKLILYVLGGRGPDTTKLALHAATVGQAVIEVQPVGADGPMALPSGGGCGSGGCGCHG